MITNTDGNIIKCFRQYRIGSDFPHCQSTMSALPSIELHLMTLAASLTADKLIEF
jgi:hypothetical protein